MVDREDYLEVSLLNSWFLLTFVHLAGFPIAEMETCLSGCIGHKTMVLSASLFLPNALCNMAAVSQAALEHLKGGCSQLK